MQGIEKLDKPLKVNTVDWAFEHLGCDALVLKDNQCSTMKILAYAVEPKYNSMLNALQMNDDSSVIFKNTNEDEVNAIDGICI